MKITNQEARDLIHRAIDRGQITQAPVNPFNIGTFMVNKSAARCTVILANQECKGDKEINEAEYLREEDLAKATEIRWAQMDRADRRGPR